MPGVVVVVIVLINYCAWCTWYIFAGGSFHLGSLILLPAISAQRQNMEPQRHQTPARKARRAVLSYDYPAVTANTRTIRPCTTPTRKQDTVHARKNTAATKHTKPRGTNVCVHNRAVKTRSSKNRGPTSCGLCAASVGVHMCGKVHHAPGVFSPRGVLFSEKRPLALGVISPRGVLFL